MTVQGAEQLAQFLEAGGEVQAEADAPNSVLLGAVPPRSHSQGSWHQYGISSKTVVLFIVFAIAFAAFLFVLTLGGSNDASASVDSARSASTISLATVICAPPQFGTNNGGINLKKVMTNNYGDCCSQCWSASGCVGYTWVKVKNECWLKSSLDGPVPDEYAISGSVNKEPVNALPQISSPSPNSVQHSTQPLAPVSAISGSVNKGPVNALPQISGLSPNSVQHSTQSMEPVSAISGSVNKGPVNALPQISGPSPNSVQHSAQSMEPVAAISGSVNRGPVNALPQISGQSPNSLQHSTQPMEPGSVMVSNQHKRNSTFATKQRHPLAPLTPTNAMGAAWAGAGPSKGHAVLAGEKSAKLLGKTLRMTVDVSQIGCGCVTGVYLVEWGDGSQCDGSGSFDARCGEIDLFEGNKFAWHTTLHNAMDHPGLAGGFGGLQQPDMNYGKGPRDMTGRQYGPGASIIDTTRPFHAAISFPKKDDGSLADLVVMLYQDGKDKAIEWRVNKPREDHTRSPPLTCENAGCKDCFSKPGCMYKEPDMKAFGTWLSQGMTPLSTYWGGPGNTWIDGVMDDEQAEGCKLGAHGQPGSENYGDYISGGGCYHSGYGITGFTVEDLKNPDYDWEDFFHHMDIEPVIDQ